MLMLVCEFSLSFVWWFCWFVFGARGGVDDFRWESVSSISGAFLFCFHTTQGLHSLPCSFLCCPYQTPTTVDSLATTPSTQSSLLQLHTLIHHTKVVHTLLPHGTNADRV